MSRSYKGGSIPPNLDPRLRQLLEDHDRALVEGIPRSNITPNLTGGSGGGDAGKPAGPVPQIAYQVSGAEGNVGTIPAQPNGSTVIFRFTGSPTLLADSGNLMLSANFTPESVNETITLVSDGVKWFEISRGRNGGIGNVFVPAGLWGATPHATQDRTSKIQAAFDNCPTGATLVFDPGTYFISNTLTLSRTINVWAYGVIFDLELNVPTTTFSPGIPENHDGVGYLTVAQREAGTLTTLAALIWGVSGTNRPERNNIWGLHVSRNASANTSAARLYAGIVMRAPFECSLHDVRVNNFREGLVLVGGLNFEGCVYNTIYEFKTTDCRYGITLYTNQSTGAGYANENAFYNGRIQLSSSVTGDADWVANFVRWEGVRLLYESGPGTIGPPNNNVFYHLNMESAGAQPEGRKARVEGRDNRFDNCRWENPGTTTITVGEASRTNSGWTRNIFTYGDSLATIVENSAIEFLASASTGVNNKNIFLTGWGSRWAGGNTAPLLELHGGSDNSLLIALAEATSTRDHRLTLRAVHPSYASGSGFVGFHNAAGTLLGGLTLDTAGALGGAVPVALRSLGLWINQNLDDRDSRVSGDIETNLTYWDANADPGSGAASGCVGFGTLSPNRLVDIELATAPQLRLTHTSGSRFTDLQANNDGTFGGLCLLPAANAGGYFSVNLFGTNEATGISIFDDLTDYWVRTNIAHNLQFNIPSPRQYVFNIGFATKLTVTENNIGTNVPIVAQIGHGADTVGEAIRVEATRSSALPAAGFGVKMQWQLENNDGGDPGVLTLASEWHSVWTTPTSGSEDADVRFLTRDGGTLKEIFRVAGALPGVRIENVVGGAPAALLDVRGSAIFNEDGAAVDFRVESDTDPTCFKVDGTNNNTQAGPVPAAIAASTAKFIAWQETSTTNAPELVFSWGHSTTGTAAVGFGSLVRGYLEDAAGTPRTALEMRTDWVNAGTTTFDARTVWYVAADGIEAGSAFAPFALSGAFSDGSCLVGNTVVSTTPEAIFHHTGGTSFFNCGMRFKREAFAGDTTFDAGDFYARMDSAGAARVVNLPATDAASIGTGKMYIVKRSGANNVTITPNGVNTVEGAATLVLAAGAAVILISNGGAGAAGNWEAVAAYP